jgi:hypothetical protein
MQHAARAVVLHVHTQKHFFTEIGIATCVPLRYPACFLWLAGWVERERPGLMRQNALQHYNKLPPLSVLVLMSDALPVPARNLAQTKAAVSRPASRPPSLYTATH